MASGTIIPCRFLSIMAHFVITIMLYWNREPNVLECIPVYSGVGSSQYSTKDTQLLVGISFSVIFLLVEVVGFFSGLSMFADFSNIFSCGFHIFGSIFLSMFVVQSWSCDTFWAIFSFCSFLPFLLEVFVIIHTLKFKVFK